MGGCLEAPGSTRQPEPYKQPLRPNVLDTFYVLLGFFQASAKRGPKGVPELHIFLQILAPQIEAASSVPLVVLSVPPVVKRG